jgi:3-hydroxyisobutyrate dehydrogenase-like beta-hydroxyacid dehydrogenase
MANIAFLGLGIMGGPMARHLIKAGHKVALWTNTTEKARKMAGETGATFAATPKEAAANAEFVFICVGDSKMSETVILGTDGVINGAKPGTIVIDTTTVSPTSSRAITEVLNTHQLSFLGAPITGSKPGAENATLTWMVGGDRAVFDKVRPLMEIMGKKIYYCGGPGMGLHAKLSQNLVLSNLLQAFNESLVLSTKAGIDPELMLDILSNSAAKSGLIEYKAPFVLRRDFEPNFSTKWMHKDIGLMLESGKELGVPLFLTATTQQLFQNAISNGLGEEDMCSTIKPLEGTAQVEVRKT